MGQNRKNCISFTSTVFVLLLFVAIVLGLPMYLFGCDDVAGGYCARYVEANGVITDSGDKIYADINVDNSEKSCQLFLGLGHLNDYVKREYNRDHYPIGKEVNVYFDTEVGNCKTLKYASRLGIAGLFFILLPFAFVVLSGLFYQIPIWYKKWIGWVKHTQNEHSNMVQERERERARENAQSNSNSAQVIELARTQLDRRKENAETHAKNLENNSKIVYKKNYYERINEMVHGSCSICKNPMQECDEYMELTCKHYLHKRCHNEWKRGSTSDQITCQNCINELSSCMV